jgi:hypothetical protein
MGTFPDTVQCFTADVAGEYVVHLVASDRHSQVKISEMTLVVAPGPKPVAVIDLVTPTALHPYFPLNTTFQVSGTSSTGSINDWNWTDFIPPPGFVPPPGSKTGLEPCGNGPAQMCFNANAPGSYHVGLTVTGPDGASEHVFVRYEVAPDQPPCLDHTTPDFQSPMIKISQAPSAAAMNMVDGLSITVDSIFDDLDPDTKLMRWFLKAPGDTAYRLVSEFPSYVFDPTVYRLGDVVRVRLEIRDRITDRADGEFVGCTEDFCSLPNLLYSKTCYQRATWQVTIQ